MHIYRRFVILLFAILITNCSLINKNSQKNQNTLRLMAYNIHHGEGLDGRIDIKRIAEVISREKPDLVALQEIDKKCTRSGKIDIAEELGTLLGMEYRFGKAMDFQGGEYGLAVLSKIIITETIRHQLPKGDEPRCALEIKVQLENYSKPVSFVSIHNSWNSEYVREKQINALLKSLGEIDHPVVLAGDFNAKHSDEPMKLLQRAGWKILARESKNKSYLEGGNSTIDFFVIRDFPKALVKYRKIDEKVASDHKPIFVEIVF